MDSKYLWGWSNIRRSDIRHFGSMDRPEDLLDPDCLGGHPSLGPDGHLLQPGHDAGGQVPRWPLRRRLLPQHHDICGGDV